MKLIDAAALLSNFLGALEGNAATRLDTRPNETDRIRAEEQPLLVLTDGFPALSESFVANEVRELIRLRVDVSVEASTRPARPDRVAARELAPVYLEDDGIARKLTALAWLASRHPLACLGDLRDRRRWRREEQVWPLRSLAPQAWRSHRRGDRHIHVHFAGPAALNALRLGRLLGTPWSLTAHAYDIYQLPRNLREKILAASFVTSGCDYTVSDLHAMSNGSAVNLHKIVMGVDPDRFRRRTPYPGGATVLAVGRLVEKKGFGVLMEAAARMRSEGAPLTKVTIAGDGPLREALQAEIVDLGLEEVVELVGWTDPDNVRELLERADLLAMPSTIASDGDRDSMPVVVKEALAMEVPVVASREVGLPELVSTDWGRLVPPRDPQALADGITEMLSLSAEERIQMGRAGRRFVVEKASVRRETERLTSLIGIGARPDNPH
jgi:glycosyltransferase involved in cell wall biosynthesis